MAATIRDSLNAARPEVRSSRAMVQTMPGYPFHIDLIDFLGLLTGKVADPDVRRSLLASLRSAVVANAQVRGLAHASGLAIWFPDNYLALKNSVESYMTLRFARESGWPQFLNRYFGDDDLKPQQPSVTQSRSAAAATSGSGGTPASTSRRCDTTSMR